MIDVTRSHDGRVETWWLDRPEARNALTLQMWRTLTELSNRVVVDRRVRVVVIRGRHGNFSAGADIVGLGRSLAADHDGSDYRATNAEAERAVAALPCPVVAAIDGHCVGGGVQLALACDLRVATPTARFAVTPAKLGIAYPAGAVARLVATVNVGAASELLLTAETITAERALQIGLIQRIVSDLDDAVDTLVDSLVRASGFTQWATKQVTAALLTHEIAVLGASLEAASLTHDDLREGLAAFREKRAPTFGDRPH